MHDVTLEGFRDRFLAAQHPLPANICEIIFGVELPSDGDKVNLVVLTRREWNHMREELMILDKVRKELVNNDTNSPYIVNTHDRFLRKLRIQNTKGKEK